MICRVRNECRSRDFRLRGRVTPSHVSYYTRMSRACPILVGIKRLLQN